MESSQVLVPISRYIMFLIKLSFGSNLYFFWKLSIFSSGCYYVYHSLQNTGYARYKLLLIHDVTVFSMILLQELIFKRTKHSVKRVLDIVRKPLPVYRPGSEASLAVERYIRQVERCGALASRYPFLYIGWMVLPVIGHYFSSENDKSTSLSLMLSRMLEPGNTILRFFGMYVVFASVTFLGTTCGLLLFASLSLGVMKLRLLVDFWVAELASIHERAEILSEQILSDMIAAGNLKFCHLCKNKLRPFGYECDKRRSRECCRRVFRETIRRLQLEKCFKKLVDSHVQIIEFSKLIDRTFRLEILLFYQIGAVVPAFIIPQIAAIWELSAIEWYIGVSEVIADLGHIAIASYFGQIVLDQGCRIRQALLEYNWVDKPLRFKKSFLIMSTMSSRDLRITAGGLLTMSLQALAWILNATYSYVQILQTFRRKIRG